MRNKTSKPHKQPAPRSSTVSIGQFDVSKIGVARFDFRDPYHLALTASWPNFAAAVFILYIAINVLFAGLYAAGPGSVGNARSGAFGDAFFFSMETLATVGYGQMYPATTYGHFVSAAEIMTGMAFTAIVTGLIFVRFSKPHAKILYADTLVVTTYNGLPTLMLRIGNGRMSLLTDLTVRLSALLREQSSEGHTFRRVHDLTLSRSHVPMFALTLTLMHPIDQNSPLAGYDATTIADGDIRLFLSVEARDSAINSIVHDIKDYTGHQILFGMRYSDTVSVDAEGRTLADLTRISLTEPDEPLAL